mmetsp:Transcript_25234/g.42568  ORF Transcript_25234/g.42568 Transcript_25234/m.42568 type:complete len:304 (+) Transcript_25234:87-998(+)
MSFFCYLLHSVKTPKSTSTYVGFTVDNRRRLRQHNGEITAGAKQTSRGRPWEHVVIISGFPNKIVALQFEWQWQHPANSRLVRDVLDCNPNRRGVNSKLDVLYCILQTNLWRQLDLQVNIFRKSAFEYFTKKAAAPRCQLWPSLDVFHTTCCQVPIDSNKENEPMSRALSGECSQDGVCVLCSGSTWAALSWNCLGCGVAAHIACLASSAFAVADGCSSGKEDTVQSIYFQCDLQESSSLVPRSVRCLSCGEVVSWRDVALLAHRECRGVHSAASNKLEGEDNTMSDDEDCDFADYGEDVIEL